MPGTPGGVSRQRKQSSTIRRQKAEATEKHQRQMQHQRQQGSNLAMCKASWGLYLVVYQVVVDVHQVLIHCLHHHGRATSAHVRASRSNSDG